jgi:F-type H+-transporting ATPase subunit epsilon
MKLEIVSPEASIFKGEVNSVSVPGTEGSFQMLKNHAPIVSILQSGNVIITANKFDFNKESIDSFKKINDQNYSLNINSGTVEMKDNKIIVLVD